MDDGIMILALFPGKLGPISRKTIEKPKENQGFWLQPFKNLRKITQNRFLGDGFAQKSILGLCFHPTVDFWVMVSPKSRCLGGGFAQKSVFG